MTEAARDEALRAQLLAGNVPSFLRRLVPVFLEAKLANGHLAHVVACVLPDYLAVGSDSDFFYVPVRLATALAVAARHGFTLPTTGLVDAIYAQSSLRLAPQPLPPGDEMRSTAYYLEHTRLIDQQRAALGASVGPLTAGHKKDLVLTGRLRAFPDRVAIYGWHKGVARPIQPLSTVHGARYADYSHGVRLVSDELLVDGVPMSMPDALAVPALARALGEESAISDLPRLLTTLGQANERATP